MYEIQSTKNTERFEGTIADAIELACQINVELQPAFGVTVYDGETSIWSTEDDRQPDDWWDWHDEDSSRWSSAEGEAVARCAAWCIGDSDDGPEV